MNTSDKKLSIWRVALGTGLVLAIITISSEGLSESEEAGKPSSRRPLLSGDLALEGLEERASIYDITQDRAIENFQNLSQYIRTASSADPAAVPDLTPDVMDYLTGVYLYCSIQRGTCPFILQTILEIDIINSILSGQNECRNMQAFWKRWLNNDMENRHRHGVRTAYIHTTQDFNKNTRPRYVRCKETVENITGNYSNSAEFFRDRYQAGSVSVRAVDFSLALIKQIKEGIPNIFHATGS